MRQICDDPYECSEPSDALRSPVPATVPQPAPTNLSLNPHHHNSIAPTLTLQLPLNCHYHFPDLMSTRTISIIAAQRLSETCAIPLLQLHTLPLQPD